jgi:hypothetical protein
MKTTELLVGWGAEDVDVFDERPDLINSSCIEEEH